MLSIVQLVSKWSVFLLGLVVILTPGPTSAASDTGKHHYNISGILNGLQIGYDKRVRPNYGGIPVQIQVSMGIITISSLSEVTMAADSPCDQTWDHSVPFVPQLGPVSSASVWPLLQFKLLAVVSSPAPLGRLYL